MAREIRDSGGEAVVQTAIANFGRLAINVTVPAFGIVAEQVRVQLTNVFTETLEPALVSPVARSPESSTPRAAGYFSRGLSTEEVAEHFAESRDETDYTVMNDPAEEVGQVLSAVTGSTTKEK